MKELTSAEYRTVLAMLSHPGATDRERMRDADLPSSTYNVVRRRIFEEGWVSDVTIPQPGPTGYAGVEIFLARPTVSQRDPLIRAARDDAECGVLWAGMHAILGVFFRAQRPLPEPGGGLGSTTEAPFRVFAGREAGSVPVYFDYAGLWARFGGEAPPARYPAGLDLASGPADARWLSLSDAILKDPASAGGSPSRWTSILRRPRPYQRAVQSGLVQSRTVIEPETIPAYSGRRVGEVVLVRGRLRGGRTAQSLLNALTAECGVYPFLLGGAEGRIILAGLGQVSARTTGRAPVPAARRPVMATLMGSLEPADVMIEPVEAVAKVVHHRYTGRARAGPVR